MRVSDYERMFRAGQTVSLRTPGGITILVRAPDPEDATAGYTEGTTASTVVEWLRALQGWIRVHHELHGWWHQLYRQQNPGGLAADQRGKEIERLEAQVGALTEGRRDDRARLAEVRGLAEEWLGAPDAAVYGKRILAALEPR